MLPKSDKPQRAASAPKRIISIHVTRSVKHFGGSGRGAPGGKNTNELGRNRQSKQIPPRLKREGKVVKATTKGEEKGGGELLGQSPTTLPLLTYRLPILFDSTYPQQEILSSSANTDRLRGNRLTTIHLALHSLFLRFRSGFVTCAPRSAL